MLYREPKLLKGTGGVLLVSCRKVSVLYREPKLLKVSKAIVRSRREMVSVLYREPKLLKARYYLPTIAGR